MAPQIAELDVIAETVRHGCDGAYRSSRATPQASFHAGATIAGHSSVTGFGSPDPGRRHNNAVAPNFRQPAGARQRRG